MTRFAPLITAAALALATVAAPDLTRAGEPVRLLSQPTSHAAVITLADLFDGVEGPAAATVVGRAAAEGQQQVLDSAVIQLAAHRAGYDWDNVGGQRRIAVLAGPADPSPVAPVRPVRALKAASAPHGRAPRAVAARPAASVLVYARNIPAGELLVPDDLVWSDAEPAFAPRAPLQDPDIAVGKVARRTLRAGAPAQVSDLAGVRVIRKDDLIFVSFQTDGLTLTLQGRALSDAAVGEPVQVMNLASKRMLEAVASGVDRALVGPDADALRSNDPTVTRFASVR